MLTEVDYRTGRLHDMAALTARRRRLGIVTIWDLAHSAGAFPVDLDRLRRRFRDRLRLQISERRPRRARLHLRAGPISRTTSRRRLSGWMGHAAPFAFDLHYRPAPGHRPPARGHPAGAVDGRARGRARRLGGRRHGVVRARSIELERSVHRQASRRVSRIASSPRRATAASAGSQVSFRIRKATR